MFTIAVGAYELDCLYDGMPGLLSEYVRRAVSSLNSST